MSIHQATVEAPETVSGFEPFVTSEVISEEFDFSVNHLAQLRYTGTGPRFYRPSPRSIRYLRSEVRAWVLASARTGTAEVD